MAQVYSFVDENGVTRLFAEIHPDPAGTPFNGGTITGQLAVDLSGTAIGDTALVVVAAPTEGPFEAQTSSGFPALSVGSGGGVQVEAERDDTDALDITYKATHAADLLNIFQNFSPFATVFRVNKGGYAGVQTHAAPADGDVATGECMLWFDQTNGAAKLMLKGKTANGTVVAASIALA